MTAKEKATEIISNFEYENNYGISEDTGLKGINQQLAKRCALIAVDEILSIGCIEVPYWQEVKQEIEKL